MRRYLAGVVVVSAIAPLGLGSWAAAQASITVSGGPYELAEADGKHTLAITVIDATETPLAASLSTRMTRAVSSSPTPARSTQTAVWQ